MTSSVNGSLTPVMATVMAHPLIWRGKQVSHLIPTLSTGHTVLDEALPGGGWPLGAVTELINDTAGCGELSLLLPALARLSRENHWITMIDPPWIPYPPALHGSGLVLEKLLLIRTQNRAESLWACEQVAHGLSGGAVLAWPDGRTWAIEVKRSLTPKLERGFHQACEDVQPAKRFAGVRVA